MSTLRTLLVGSAPSRTLIRAAVTAVGLLLASRLLVTPLWATGISMAPTITDGQLLLVNRVAYRFGGGPRRGDIVAIRLAGGAAALVKRVVGLPGERVSLQDGVLLVEGEPVVEPYVVKRAPWEVPEVRLGTNEYFVIGDNREMPAHLHDFGSTHRSRIMGRLIR